jgi:hypothetical protein
MKRRKLHPADAANDAVLASAVRYDVALFLGTGRYVRASAPTLEDGRIEAMRLVAENPIPFGKRLPLIYGVIAQGTSALAEVPDLTMLKVGNTRL